MGHTPDNPLSNTNLPQVEVILPFGRPRVASRSRWVVNVLVSTATVIAPLSARTQLLQWVLVIGHNPWHKSGVGLSPTNYEVPIEWTLKCNVMGRRCITILSLGSNMSYLQGMGRNPLRCGKIEELYICRPFTSVSWWVAFASAPLLLRSFSGACRRTTMGPFGGLNA